MRTSNYRKAEFLSIEGAISISRSLYPPFRRRRYTTYRPLAPGDWYDRVDREEYCKLYADILSKLDPRKVWADLHRICPEPVLCCYEVIPDELALVEARSLPPANFCHRRLVAEWFERELGVTVPEVTTGERQLTIWEANE